MLLRGLSYFVAISALTAVVACSPVKFDQATQASTGGPGTTSIGGTPTPNPTPVGTASPTPNPVSVSLDYVNSIAWEDLYYPPGAPSTAPDFDYNDFVTEFQIHLVSTAVAKCTTGYQSKCLSDIYIDFYPRAVGAGDDHALILAVNGLQAANLWGSSNPSFSNFMTMPQPLNAQSPYNVIKPSAPMFNGAATVTMSYFTSNATPTDVGASDTAVPSQVFSGLDYTKPIVIYPSTHGIFGASGTINTNSANGAVFAGTTVPTNYLFAQTHARIHIALNAALNPMPASTSALAGTFRVMLYNIETKYAIDIINVVPNNFVPSTSTTENGFPWGFIIPSDWQWPLEGNPISNGYPNIDNYAQYLLKGLPNPPPCGVYQWFSMTEPVACPTVTVKPNNNLYPAVPFEQTMPDYSTTPTTP